MKVAGNALPEVEGDVVRREHDVRPVQNRGGIDAAPLPGEIGEPFVQAGETCRRALDGAGWEARRVGAEFLDRSVGARRASWIGTAAARPLDRYQDVATASFCSDSDSSSSDRSGDTRVPYCSCARKSENRSPRPAAATTTRARNGTNKTRRSFALKLSFVNTLG